MARWLSAEWFEQVQALSGDRPERPGLSARLQYEVVGAPGGDVRCFQVLVDGRLEASGLGDVDRPDVTLTTSWSDAAAIQRGELDPNVAFMQGRMKVAGSMGTMMSLLPVTGTPEYGELRDRIAELTEF